eukprot:jgi/Psemu1/300401/fgenesh1_kg.11_\
MGEESKKINRVQKTIHGSRFPRAKDAIWSSTLPPIPDTVGTDYCSKKGCIVVWDEQWMGRE